MMRNEGESRLSDWVRARDRPLEGDPAALDPLLEMIDDRQLVLLGEGTHGTAEFYRIRQKITERLIREISFSFIAIEGD